MNPSRVSGQDENRRGRRLSDTKSFKPKTTEPTGYHLTHGLFFSSPHHTARGP